ncbi:probable folate-biopterin transporter 4 isoform X2 [Dendrobium catenatum]|uniref:probable folate-biopterin transporter 4 isoform X2 n=1 Tax=Dendrobium catenatum TaxID=906689 RepID=UPI0009F5057E|nr:probable folate-biopterin transporter 4 isoform X2 [Dendrobium catenatum]
MAIRWMRRMGGSFGASFLWIVSLIYFTQGFRSFVWTAVSYQMKDILKLSPSSSQFMFSIAFFPWSIKPAYGILSDCIPINGCKRKPYLVIATVLSLIPWPVLGLISSLMNSHNFLTALLTMQNLGSAMADVVIDAMIAEAVRSERAEFAGDLQSLSWLMMAVGGICGNLLGGYALSSFRICSIFLLFSILPGIQLLSCAFIKEASSEYPDIGDLKNSNLQERLYSSTISPVGASKSEALRRRKKERNHDCSKLSYREAEDVKEKGSLALSLRRFQSMRSAIYSLYDAFKNPLILRLAHVGLGAVNFLDIVLVSGLNTRLSIPDKYMVLGGSAVADAINQFKLMPFLILSGQLCPPGIEGTLFALFMSINNLGSSVGSFYGAALASVLGISTNSFRNILYGLLIQLFSTFIPIGLLFLIPKEATGLASEKL